MLRLIAWFIRSIIFAVIVLVLANWVEWNGKTACTHVHAWVKEAERSQTYKEMKSFVNRHTGSLQRWYYEKLGGQDSISDAERQKLKELIRDTQ